VFIIFYYCWIIRHKIIRAMKMEKGAITKIICNVGSKMVSGSLLG
jgi:hypothetical protein